jgi:hypothetical protein
MNWKIALSVATAGLLSLSVGPQVAAAKSPVEAGSKPQRQCFFNQQVNGFTARDDKIVNVRVGVKDVYQLEMLGRCHDINWAEKIALVSRGGSTICTGLDAEIVSPSAIGPQRCPVSNIRKLTPAEIDALPKRSRP